MVFLRIIAIGCTDIFIPWRKVCISFLGYPFFNIRINFVVKIFHLFSKALVFIPLHFNYNHTLQNRHRELSLSHRDNVLSFSNKERLIFLTQDVLDFPSFNAAVIFIVVFFFSYFYFLLFGKSCIERFRDIVYFNSINE